VESSDLESTKYYPSFDEESADLGYANLSRYMGKRRARETAPHRRERLFEDGGKFKTTEGRCRTSTSEEGGRAFRVKRKGLEKEEGEEILAQERFFPVGDIASGATCPQRARKTKNSGLRGGGWKPKGDPHTIGGNATITKWGFVSSAGKVSFIETE